MGLLPGVVGDPVMSGQQNRLSAPICDRHTFVQSVHEINQPTCVLSAFSKSTTSASFLWSDRRLSPGGNNKGYLAACTDT